MKKPPEIPQSLYELMAEVGPRWRENVAGNVELMAERFSEILKTAPKSGISVQKNLAYGSHARQAVDVFLPEAPKREKPAVLFVHGGAFVSGDRNRTEEFYANVLYYFARHGIIGINIGYRLADSAKYPEATLDIAAATDFVHEHAAEFGIDRKRVFLMSHSAGSAHAGSYGYDPRFQALRGSKIAGMIVVSGRVRIDNLAENPNARKVEAYYGADASRFDEYSPVSHVGADSLPTLVAWSEYENPLIDLYCSELVFRLATAKRKSPPVVWLQGHNHTSAVAHINTAEDQLGKAMLAFIAAPR